jgi:hypothetical protein
LAGKSIPEAPAAVALADRIVSSAAFVRPISWSEGKWNFQMASNFWK